MDTMDIEIDKEQADILEKLIDMESDYTDVIETKTEKEKLIRHLKETNKIPHGYWFDIMDIIGTWNGNLTAKEKKTILPIYSRCTDKLYKHNNFAGQTIQKFA